MQKITENDKTFMSEALGEAAKARDDNDWAIGCVITLDDKVIIRGRNRVHSTRNRLAHAEMDALQQLQVKHFDRAHKDRLVLYTTFEPCIMCFGAILVSGVKHVVSGIDFDDSGISSYIGHIPRFFQHTNFKTDFTTGILAKECAEMWLSSAPAQRIVAEGYKLPMDIEGLQNIEVKIYTTPLTDSGRK